ncbi:MAG TPA: efflux RND transporter permease subunit [Candidatus Angelobacter sp.]|nr:efflux RND transporter permease subunit [Candidatus Angelobacter sp.]
MAHKSDTEIIQHKHNTARFFVEHRQVALVLLLGTMLWGWYGFSKMPKRKDPVIPVRVAVASCQWPGATAEEVEQLITRPIEQAMAQNQTVKPPSGSEYGIRSLSFPNFALVFVQLDENVKDTIKQLNDINLRLNELSEKLPQGAGPIRFNSNFGDTAALMLTVASPRASSIDVALRARAVSNAIKTVRESQSKSEHQSRTSIVFCFPQSIAAEELRSSFQLVQDLGIREGAFRDPRIFEGPGFIGLDIHPLLSDDALQAWGERIKQEHFHRSEIHPDAWNPAFIHDPQETESRLSAAAGDKYSYRELDDFTALIQRTLQGTPEVSKVDRSGVLAERVYLDYSQQRLAEYGVKPADLRQALSSRNITLPGGVLEVDSKNVTLDPSGKFEDARAIGDVIIGTAASASNSPVYLRDLVDISRGYESPARYLNYITWHDRDGHWQRSRAVTLAVQMRDGQQVAQFGKSVDEKLAAVKHYLPDDLIIARTSDQPLQVKENIDLFMGALYEAIILVVIVSLVGFWEWRSALLMAISIPVTLAMTFGMMYMLGIDIQQVSVATLIIALGLLVDDPVVAGDSIKRGLAEGHPSVVASWLGPTKLATAIMFATITNIAAYIPFLLLTGTMGEFLHSLPIVMACSLVASRLASMTFVPLLGYYLLRRDKKPEKSIEERRTKGFTGFYARVAKSAIEHRWKVFAGSVAFLALGVLFASQLKTAFMPNDVQYWSYIDVWLPNDANLDATNQTAQEVERVVREEALRFAEEHAGKDQKPEQVLKFVTTFVGGGAPRFWFSVSPQLQQLNYAQVLIEVTDKEITPEFVKHLQPILSARIPGARVDIRQLQYAAIDFPLDILITHNADVSAAQSSEEIRTLRRLAGQLEDIFRSLPTTAGVRNDWDSESSGMKLTIDPDRANLAGVTNQDVASSSTSAMSGAQLTTLQEGNKEIPVVARLKVAERAQLSDIQNLYVYASQGTSKIPLVEVSKIEHSMQTDRIIRLDHFRTIAVRCFPKNGVLSSEVLNAATPKLREFEKNLPPGYKIRMGGDYYQQHRGFGELGIVMAASIFLIFLALVFQFNSSVKPLLVFAAAPYGVVGAVVALWIMGTPFGFMAFLGVASLIGVIVSHVIVLFDFIEEKHEEGEPFEEAVIDAGIIRLRPVMITVGATVLALFPLALHGGPLWQPLCYTQIGGLAVATFITLLLVPVLYAIFVLDLKLLKWETKEEKGLLAVRGEAAD